LVSLPERRALGLLLVAGSAVLVLFLGFRVVNPRRPVVENTPGFSDPVVGFELASRAEDVFGILGAPGTPERVDAVRRMTLGIRLDFLFLIAYPTFTVAIAMLLAARGAAPSALVAGVLGLALAMALGDALENRELLRLASMLDSAAMAPALIRLRVFTLVKWYALYAAAGVLAFPVWRQPDWWRWSAPLFALAAACGLASLVHLPAIEWGIAPLGAAWLMAYVRAFRRQST